MLLTKEEWLSGKPVSERDKTILDAAYEVLKKNTIHSKNAPWGMFRWCPRGRVPAPASGTGIPPFTP